MRTLVLKGISKDFHGHNVTVLKKEYNNNNWLHIFHHVSELGPCLILKVERFVKMTHHWKKQPPELLCKKNVFKISQNLQESTCDRAFF